MSDNATREKREAALAKLASMEGVLLRERVRLHRFMILVTPKSLGHLQNRKTPKSSQFFAYFWSIFLFFLRIFLLLSGFRGFSIL